MKKAFALFIGVLLFASCEKESIISEIKEIKIDQSSFLKKGDKVDVCHKGKIINVSVNSLSAHQGHGDAVDLDGDGYFDIENYCSEVDCDDTAYSEDNSCGPEMGDFYQGGIVFFLDETGKHGLVCAVSNTPSAKVNWNSAISFCNNYSLTVEGVVYDDWYLPSRDELNQMYINRIATNGVATANGGANYSNSSYWSSTEPNSYYAWKQDFNDGQQYYGGKSYPPSYGRAVRAF
ncbi:MAG: hypothetical protein ACI9FW_001770 [Flavobacterium sp.]|jgi:hypothetical protein